MGGLWSGDSAGELFLAPLPDDGPAAFGIVNTAPPAAGQLYTSAKLEPGRYAVSFDYLVTGTAQGRFELRAVDLDAGEIVPSDAASAEKTEAANGGAGRTYVLRSARSLAPFVTTFELKRPAEVSLVFQNGTVGTDSAFRFTNVALRPADEKTTKALTEASAPQAPDAYHAALAGELATKHGLSGGFSVLGATEASAAKRFQLNGPAADGATLTQVEVDAADGVPFRTATRVNVHRPRGEAWHIMLQALNGAPVRKGDVLLVVAYARGRVPGVGSSEAHTSIALKRRAAPQATYAEQTGLIVSDRWERIFLPFVAGDDCAPGELEWISVVGSRVQEIDLGGVSILNFGSAAKLSAMPGATPDKVDYAGRDAEAPWRAAAAERIERARKADLVVNVVNGGGRPVPNADVRVTMASHAFRWGTALVPSLSFLDPSPTWADPASIKVERELVPKLFNQVTTDIELKFQFWYGQTVEWKQRAIDGLRVTRDKGLTIRGHCLVWPGFSNMPQLDAMKDDPAAMREAIKQHILELGSRTAPYCRTWDVVNEPMGNQAITNLLGGREVMVEWFRLARQVLPDAKLYINEAFTPGDGSATEANFFETCKFLVDAGAPVDGFGFQCHVGNRPIDIEKVHAALDRFAALKPGVELAITEFDINCRGDQRLEGDYLRDLTTIAFAHPNVVEFTMWGFYGKYHWLGYAPLYNDDGTLRPAGQEWTRLVHHDWKTDATGPTDAGGAYRARGVHGDYDVTVTHGGRTSRAKVALPADGVTVTVRLDEPPG